MNLTDDRLPIFLKPRNSSAARTVIINAVGYYFGIRTALY
ncbi:Uncharacterized protein dnm_037130 [Desulfonema magnum]|uniref:Uncharacterized protein n=1 Tax=Desulfonema magnum TaxID=45655 RepID=A0A975BL28_9BACT|nr:Uncharacterized protein dnm_037130 [Desulfonema magnum]